jgi:hypothetical protein
MRPRPPDKELRSDPDREAAKIKPSHSEELRQVIEQYANDLREIIKKLRRRFH